MKAVRSAPRSEINITPLIDIVLVLLIVFIVMVPALQVAQRAQAGAPRGRAEAGGETPRIQALADGRLLLEGEEVTPALLVERLVADFSGRKPDQRKVILRVAGESPLLVATAALDLVHQAAGRVGGSKDVRSLLVEANAP